MEAQGTEAALARRRVTCPFSVSQLCDIIMSFVEVYSAPSQIYLHSYQRVFMRRIIEAVIEHTDLDITALWSRQSGKSTAIACLAPGLCILLPTLANAFPDDERLTLFKRGVWIGIFAPKQEQAAIIFGAIRTAAEKSEAKEIYNDPDIMVNVAVSRGDQVSWTNGSFVTAQTASEQSSVEGKTYHIVIIDEAQLVSKHKVEKEIVPMLASTNGVMVKIGTANALRGGFRESIIQNTEAEKKGHKRNHFEFPYELVLSARQDTYEKTKDKKHLLYGDFVRKSIKRLGGIENEEFRQNFRLLWQEANLGAVDMDAFEACADLEMEWEPFCQNKRLVAGLDYGKKRDVTVLTIGEVEDVGLVDTRALIRPGDEAPVFPIKRIIAWYEVPGRRWNDILTEVVEILGHYCVDTLVCDATGVGDPLTERMQDLMPGIQIVPFIMSHVGNDKIFKLYLQEIEAERMRYVAGPETKRLPVFEEFFHEHSQLIKDRNGVYTKCYAPEGEHDDMCDSAALFCWAAHLPRPDMEAEDTSNPFYADRRSASNYSSRSDRYRR